jgi:hypothetical protein
MKALVYKGPRSVGVDNVPDAKIEKPTDVLVRMTTTNICGSDLHMYEGRTSCRAAAYRRNLSVWHIALHEIRERLLDHSQDCSILWTKKINDYNRLPWVRYLRMLT